MDQTGLKIYQEQIKQIPVLSSLEERILASKRDKESKDKLVTANLRLVIPWAYHYQGRGLDIEDLIEEGNLGLMHAVEKYNPASENKFCTYAAWWIKQYMVRAIENQSQAIRIPVHMIEDIEKIKIASRDLYVILGRLPTEKELSEKTNIKVDRVKEAMSYMIDMTSLDKTVNEEEDTSIGDLIEDTKFVNPESLYMNQASKDLIIAVVDTLEERESKIIKLRYGLLEDGISYSLEDIGKKLNLSKERVRQLEKRASRKLRNPIRLKVLKEYL